MGSNKEYQQQSCPRGEARETPVFIGQGDEAIEQRRLA